MAIPMAVGSTVDIQINGGMGGDSGTVVAITGTYIEITSTVDPSFPDKVYPWDSIISISVIS